MGRGHISVCVRAGGFVFVCSFPKRAEVWCACASITNGEAVLVCLRLCAWGEGFLLEAGYRIHKDNHPICTTYAGVSHPKGI